MVLKNPCLPVAPENVHRCSFPLRSFPVVTEGRWQLLSRGARQPLWPVVYPQKTLLRSVASLVRHPLRGLHIEKLFHLNPVVQGQKQGDEQARKTGEPHNSGSTEGR